MGHDRGGFTDYTPPKPTKRQRLSSLLSQLEAAVIMERKCALRSKRLREEIQDLMEGGN
jgi:hypothetical protein